MPNTSTVRAAARAEDVATSPWIDRAARLGFGGRGVIYVIIGVLAAQIALSDNSDENANRQGALQAIADKPLGKVLLVVLAIGLAGYVMWRFSDAIWGEKRETDAKKRTAKRLSSAGKGLVYAAFCASTISVIAGSGANQDEQTEKTWTAKVLGWPGGRGIVTVIGLAVVAGGLYLVYQGVTRKFEKKLATREMSPTTRTVERVLGTFGVAARGVVFALAGLLLVKAAADFDPNEAQGIDGTLRTIANRPYGQVLLILAAVGLVAFGAFSFFEARYRQL